MFDNLDEEKTLNELIEVREESPLENRDSLQAVTSEGDCGELQGEGVLCNAKGERLGVRNISVLHDHRKTLLTS